MFNNKCTLQYVPLFFPCKFFLYALAVSLLIYIFTLRIYLWELQLYKEIDWPDQEQTHKYEEKNSFHINMYLNMDLSKSNRFADAKWKINIHGVTNEALREWKERPWIMS